MAEDDIGARREFTVTPLPDLFHGVVRVDGRWYSGTPGVEYRVTVERVTPLPVEQVWWHLVKLPAGGMASVEIRTDDDCRWVADFKTVDVAQLVVKAHNGSLAG